MNAKRRCRHEINTSTLGTRLHNAFFSDPRRLEVPQFLRSGIQFLASKASECRVHKSSAAHRFSTTVARRRRAAAPPPPGGD